jgi:hypothetical protein
MSLGRELKDFVGAFNTTARTIGRNRYYDALAKYRTGRGGAGGPPDDWLRSQLGPPPPGVAGPDGPGFLTRAGNWLDRQFGGGGGGGSDGGGALPIGGPAGGYTPGYLDGVPGGMPDPDNYGSLPPNAQVGADIIDDTNPPSGSDSYADGGGVQDAPYTLADPALPSMGSYMPADAPPQASPQGGASDAPYTLADPALPPPEAYEVQRDVAAEPPIPMPSQGASAPSQGALPVGGRKALNDQTRTEAYDPTLDGPTAALPAGSLDNGRAPVTNIPSTDLERAIDGGLRFAQKTFHLEPQTAVGPDPHTAGGAHALMTGVGAAPDDVVQAIDQRVNQGVVPNDQIYAIRRLEATYRWYSMNGETDKANKAAFELLQYSAGVAAKFGQQAVQQYQQGDMPAAIRSVQAGYNQVPDGRHMTVQGNTATIVDTRTGKPVQQFQFTPEQVFDAAMGLSSRSLYWQTLAGRVAHLGGGKQSTRTQSQQDLDEARAGYYRARTDKVKAGGGAPAGASAAQALIEKIKAAGGQATQPKTPPQGASDVDEPHDQDDDEDEPAPPAGSAAPADANGQGDSIPPEAPPEALPDGGQSVVRLKPRGTAGTGSNPLLSRPVPSDGGMPAATGAPAAASDTGGGRQLPEEGVLPGELHLNPKIAPKAVNGVRPFAPGEYVRNPDGSWSSEISATVSDPVLNDGRPTNVPTLWLVNGKPTRVDEDTAAAYAAKSGLKFPSYDTPQAADKAAADREAQWQHIEPENASSVNALWEPPVSGKQIADPSHPGYQEHDPDAVPDVLVHRNGDTYAPPPQPRPFTEEPPGPNPYLQFQAEAALIPGKDGARVRAYLNSQVKQYNDTVRAYTNRKKAWDQQEAKRVADETKAANATQKQELRESLGYNLKPNDVQAIDDRVDELYKNYSTGVAQPNDTPEQTQARAAQIKDMGDPATVKDIATDLVKRNKLSAAQALRWTGELTSVDPLNPNARKYTVHGKDALGNVLVTVPGAPPLHISPYAFKDIVGTVKQRLARANHDRGTRIEKAIQPTIGQQLGKVGRAIRKADDLSVNPNVPGGPILTPADAARVRRLQQSGAPQPGPTGAFGALP